MKILFDIILVFNELLLVKNAIIPFYIFIQESPHINLEARAKTHYILLSHMLASEKRMSLYYPVHKTQCDQSIGKVWSESKR